MSTVTAEPSRIRLVRPAMAASTTSGADMAKSGRWCSPTPKASMPSWSASTACSITSRMTWACVLRRPSGPAVTSPNVSSPNSMGVQQPGCSSRNQGRRRRVQGYAAAASAPIAECANSTALPKSKRGATISGASRANSSTRPVIRSRMMKSGPVRRTGQAGQTDKPEQ